MLQSRSLWSCRGYALLGFLCLGLSSAPAWAAKPKDDNGTHLDQKAFFRPELYITSSNVELQELLGQLPNRAAWDGFLAKNQGVNGESRFVVHLDPRSGAVSDLMGPVPMIPGRGVGNRLTLASLGQRLGRAVTAVDPAVVRDAVMAFAKEHQAILGIDASQLGEARAVQVNPDLWQISIPQMVGGIPVRDARLLATISHGNMVLMGTEVWGSARLSVTPLVKAEQALEAGFAYADGRAANDEMVREPRLEIIPFAPPDQQSGEAFAGAPGKGYGHRLAWTFVFVRPPEGAQWEVMVDAHSGEVIAFQDINHYVKEQIRGGVYPLTDTGICPTPQTCGTMQTNWPMPFANTGLASPNNFTNSGGIFEFTGGTATTTLSGQFVRISDACGAISNSAAGSINLGGTNNQHDCTTGGGSAGNTPAARSGFYELNKLKEQARGWLPGNTWLQAQITANMNINQTCNAFWNGSTVNFYRSGGGCRNTGELAAVFDHEWGHGMDDNDAAGALSNSSEAYADIAAIYRLQASCVGHGFFDNTSTGACGTTADGTGRNVNEAQTGAAYCATDCSGVRDTDSAKHNPVRTITPLNFSCPQCSTGSGPCGRQVHCTAAPVRQAAWDLVARDLQSAPFNLDKQTAFMIGNKLFYQGSGNIGAWHSCACGGTADGCATANGYKQWLAADDDNGNINDGTPHFSAIRAAFDRHGIACATPNPTPTPDTGCSGVPVAPTLSATPGNFQASLSWNSVAGATGGYWVMRTEGHAGCDMGKARIETPAAGATSFTDMSVANGRAYSYNVVAQGGSTSCFSRVSNCVTVTPTAGANPDFSVSCSPSSLTVAQGGSSGTTCTVTSTNGFSSPVSLGCTGLPAGASCAFNPSSVTPPANGSASSSLTVSAGAGTATGTTSFLVNGTNGGNTRSANMSLTVTAVNNVVFFDNFETSLGWTTNPNGTDTATTGQWARANPEPTSSGIALQNGTTVSGVNDLVTGPLAGASAGVNDVDGGTTSIQSPLINLPAGVNLTMTFSWYLAHLTNATSADFFRVSIVSGATTTQVFQQLGSGVNRTGTFATATVSLNAFAGQSVRILIQAADAATGSLIEAAVDDVRITRQ